MDRNMLCCVCFALLPHLFMSQTYSRPNIVIFLADDMGIGDIGPYGNKTLRTPNIDSLARDGMKLTHHLAAESLCTPSRAALLTGRYTKRYGMDSGALRALINTASPTGLPTSEITFAELAKAAGYKTALVGKWHLGVYDILGNPVYHPISRGFDYFYGIPLSVAVDLGDEGIKTIPLVFPNITRDFITVICITMLTLVFLFKVKVLQFRIFVWLFIFCTIIFLEFYASFFCTHMSVGPLMKNFEGIEMPMRLIGLTERLARESVEFIKNQTESGNPFLLFVSWGHMHTFLAPSSKFAGRSRHDRYGDCVEELDWATGIVLQALDDAGARNNTLVYFTSDHGGSTFDVGLNGQIDGGYNGIYRGGKGFGGVDGGIRVPGLFRWPGVIKPGSTSDLVTTQLDIFPLVSVLTNSPIPNDRDIDGKNILPLLQGQVTESPYQFVFHYCDGIINAVRYMPRGEPKVWKLIHRLPSLNLNDSYSVKEFLICRDYLQLETPLLFDITSDPGENQPLNITLDPKYTEIISKITEATESHSKGISPVESRLTLLRLLWYPHLQPYCNFPWFTCIEEKYKTEDIS